MKQRIILLFTTIFLIDTVAFGQQQDDATAVLTLAHSLYGENCQSLPDLASTEKVEKFRDPNGHVRDVYKVFCGDFLSDTSYIYFVRDRFNQIKPVAFPIPMYDFEHDQDGNIICLDEFGIFPNALLDAVAYDETTGNFILDGSQSSHSTGTDLKASWRLWDSSALLTQFSHDILAGEAVKYLTLYDIDKNNEKTKIDPCSK